MPAAASVAVWTPCIVHGLETIRTLRALSTATEHSLALSAEGRLYAWGGARHGKLGFGELSRLPHERGDPYQPVPRMMHALRELCVVACAAGESHSIALCTRRATPSSPPVGRAAGMAGVGEGARGGYQSVMPCAGAVVAASAWAGLSAAPIGAQTYVYTWGLATRGRLGIVPPPPPSPRVYVYGGEPSSPLPPSPSTRPGYGGDTPSEPSEAHAGALASPEPSLPPTPGAHLRPSAADSTHHLRMRSGAGDAASAPDADDGAPCVLSPQHVVALDSCRVSSIAAGSAHSFATAASGACYGWGLATNGRLGMGREDAIPQDARGEIYVAQPTLMRGLAGYHVACIATADTHAIACTSNGQLLTWGSAQHGKLGFEAGGLLVLPTEADGTAYQPLPRQLWLRPRPPARKAIQGGGGALLPMANTQAPVCQDL